MSLCFSLTPNKPNKRSDVLDDSSIDVVRKLRRTQEQKRRNEVNEVMRNGQYAEASPVRGKFVNSEFFNDSLSHTWQ